MLETLLVPSLPDLRADRIMGITLQPAEDVSQQLSEPGIMFHNRAAVRKAAEMGYIALYCPHTLDYGRANGNAIVMQRSVRGQVFAVLRVTGEPLATDELMPWYKNDMILSNGRELAISDCWPWSIQVLHVYQFKIAPYIEKIIDTQKGWWVRRLYGVVEIRASVFDGYELVDCGSPVEFQRNSQFSPAVKEQLPDLIELSALRNGVSFDEARRSDTLYALASSLRKNELKVGIGIMDCEQRLIEAKRWLGPDVTILQRYSAPGIAASLEHNIHRLLKARGRHVGGEWFRTSLDELDSLVAELLIAQRRKIG